jgi:ATP-binding cassette subfamily B protein
MSQDPSVTEKIQTALHLDRAVRLVWSIAPGWTVANAVLAVVQGVLPLAGLYLMKRIVDAIAVGVTAADPTAAFQPVLTWILLAGGVSLLSALVKSAADVASEAQSLAVTDAVSDVVHAQSIALDLGYYEDPRYYDALHRAQREAPYRPTRIVNGLIQLGQSGLSLLGLGALVFAANGLVGLVLCAAALPGAAVRLIYSQRLYAFEHRQTEVERRAWYYHWLMTFGRYAKEIRLFNLGALLRERFRDLRSGLREGRLALSRRRAVGDLLAQAVAATAIFGSFALISYQAVQGGITLGDVVMYYQGFQIGLRQLQAVLRSLTGLYEDNLFLTNYYKFLDLTAKIQVPVRPRLVPHPMRQGIVFEGVHFTYPSGSREVLSDIHLSLAPGEVIALVGENGSGKTTLVKLLCRLYDPTAGKITVDGHDLRDIDPVHWRQRISVIFQDYVQYHLTAWENIWLGNVQLEPNRAHIEQAARRAGADVVIGRLSQGYDTMLGHEFQDGQELSVGEWQRIALARAFMRDAQIIVLDEPASFLDPLAEAELFQHFRQLITGRSGILISHRFSTVRMADTIYVLGDGRILECGSHEELLRQGGMYARLFQTQARNYR